MVFFFFFWASGLVGSNYFHSATNKKMESPPLCLNIISKDRECHTKERKKRHGISEDRKLELRLGPPGEDRSRHCVDSLSSVAAPHGAKRGFQDTLEDTPWPFGPFHQSSSSAFATQLNHPPKSSYLQYSIGAIVNASPMPCPTSMADQMQQYKDMIACPVAAAAASVSVSANTAVPNTSQKRFTFSLSFFPLLSIIPLGKKTVGKKTLLSPFTRDDNEVTCLNMSLNS